MSLKQMSDGFRSLAVRLTLLYAGIFTLSSLIAFYLFYYMIIGVIRDRVDQDLIQRVNAISAIVASDGLSQVNRSAVMETQAAGEEKLFIRLLSRFGIEVFSSNLSYWENIGIDGEAVRRVLVDGVPVFETVRVPGTGRTARIVYGTVGAGIIVQIGQSLEGGSRLLDAYRRMFAVTLFFLLLLSALIGGFMARHALSGVGRISKVARRITEGDLDSRVPVTKRRDEIDSLADTINQMLDRIQSLVAEIREMGDNIAHDLKSPITRIRGLAEVTLMTGKQIADFEQMAASIIEDSDRLLDMINIMLEISRTESGVGVRLDETVDLDGLLRKACDLFLTLAEDKNIRLVCRVDGPEPVRVRGDQRQLQRMIANLLDNAIGYTEPGGEVRVELEIDPNRRVMIRFEDSGIGIPEKALGRIFERFYRIDPSRSSAGAGLGLSLAHAIVRSHNGNITVESTPGRGSCFTVSLPAINAVDEASQPVASSPKP
jgi:heavy metal sensor kinase